ncbi:hypothetical protein C440_14094 [Haloferax mucosum ATCC BAA-1512]|uniref:Phenylacetic acid degradation B n=1 Tax=Haloferax mucosum ATCC BAA-1512 TaxID=662479 RepID=M0I3X1_9EURY|nr:Htur_1727 family rSAM-partnered candidate RiPP [Haloferax mucosum]ELZ91451.1 hypothetical protein C440_14094 [Haloferax mucosum ATCC BAA-1512]
MDRDDDPRRKARIDGSRQWEVFYREQSADPMRHVGGVTAPSLDIAVEQARTLFGDDSESLWLCPADEIVRLGGNNLRAPERTPVDATGATDAADPEVSTE